MKYGIQLNISCLILRIFLLSFCACLDYIIKVGFSYVLGKCRCQLDFCAELYLIGLILQ